jgi:S1-C subfamily serine protease
MVGCIAAVWILVACSAESHGPAHERICSSAAGGEDRALRASPLASAVALFGRDPSSGAAFICSATVVGPRTVLTAKHCIRDRDAWELDVVMDGDAARATRILRVVARDVHPTLDIAALTLASDAGAPALAWGDPGSGFAALVRSYRAIGYGGPDGDAARCLRTEITARVVVAEPGADAVLAEGDEAICEGDSGGPLVADVGGSPRVFGVASKAFLESRRETCSTTVAFAALRRDDDWLTAKLGPAPP